MRIAGGKSKGKKLNFPELKPGVRLKPTTQLVRQAIFNTLFSLIELEGINVLDLYSGTGSLGLEALSRKAGFVTFVEQESAYSKNLWQNILKLGVSDQSKVLNLSVEAAMSELEGQKFDLIIADPPYDNHPGDELLEIIFHAKLLKPGALFVVGAGKKTKIFDISLEKEPASGFIDNFNLLKQKKYGDTTISFIEMNH